MEGIHSPFRYPGGKYYARKHIMPHIPKHNEYLEPLCGGASIFFAKEKVKINILNDADERLINCFKQIRDNPEKIMEFLEGYPAKKDIHTYFKEEFEPENDIERAARFFYLNRTSFSGIMKMQNCYWGYGDEYSKGPENWGDQLQKNSRKLEGVKLLCKDFEPVINNASDGAFLFIDPPYYDRDQDKFYAETFDKKDHKRLANTLKKNSDRLRFLLTYDDYSEVRELYEWADYILEESWNYTINRTDDQTKDNSYENEGERREGQEIFILNYESPKIKIKEEKIPNF